MNVEFWYWPEFQPIKNKLRKNEDLKVKVWELSGQNIEQIRRITASCQEAYLGETHLELYFWQEQQLNLIYVIRGNYEDLHQLSLSFQLTWGGYFER